MSSNDSDSDSSECEIEEKIMLLRKELVDSVNHLILRRVTKLIQCKPENIFDFRVSVKDLDWWMEYEHVTANFDSRNYLPPDFFESKSEVGFRSTHVRLGFEDGCFSLDGYKEDTIDIYRRGQKIIGTNSAYLCDLDRNSQADLIQTYAENVDVPEWLALKFVLAISKKNLDDDEIVDILSVR
jgi:hypothetical protein